MSCTRFRLPGDIIVHILRAQGAVSAALLRRMVAAEWYVLIGPTTSSSGSATGYGAYVGTSDALHARTMRVGVSLHHWSTRLGRLRPEAVVLIHRHGRPVDGDTRLLVEAGLARAISAMQFSVLNVRTSAPTAWRRASRHQRLWANQIAATLASALYGRLLWHHAPGAMGGSVREQLVRTVLSQRPLRGMDVDQVLQAAALSGLQVAGKFPRPRTRRDMTTRELDSCRPRLYRTWVNGKTVVYPSTLSRKEAIDTYRAASVGRAMRAARRRRRPPRPRGQR